MAVTGNRSKRTRPRTAPLARSGPLTRDAWATAALWHMGRSGSMNLSVERLAQELGVTKGSFYWHFKTRDELLAAALEVWEKVATEGVIRDLASLSDPRERLRQLLAVIFKEPDELAVEGVILGAADHPKWGHIVRRVSKRRLRYVVEAYAESGLPLAQAEHWGFLTYSAYVGALAVIRTTSGAIDAVELKRYARHLNQVLVP